MNHAVFFDCLFEALTHRKGPSRDPFDLLLRLEALLAFAEFAIGWIDLVCLHLVAFVCFVTSDNAASRRSQNSMVSSKMACDATDGRAFEAALCLN